MAEEINERTRVGLFAVMGILPIVTALVFFISTIYYKASASESRLDRQAEAIKEQRLMLVEIKERTARIEAMISIMNTK